MCEAKGRILRGIPGSVSSTMTIFKKTYRVARVAITSHRQHGGVGTLTKDSGQSWATSLARVVPFQRFAVVLFLKDFLSLGALVSLLREEDGPWQSGCH